jgi:asparagine synthetase B (glutamine-hydrolysing)
MFFFALTRQSIAHRFEHDPRFRTFREISTGTWTATAVTDEWLSRCDASPDEITLRESLAFAPDAPEALLLAEVHFVEKAQTVEVERTLEGGRQLYYSLGPAGEFFCATHLALLRAAGVGLVENSEALGELFVYRYVTPPGTLFKGIQQLAAGQRLRFEFDGDAWRVSTTSHYSPPHAGDHARGRQEYSEQAGEALRQSMLAVTGGARRLRVLASGGLDSSILFKLAQRDLGINESYSTGYPFEGDERNVEKRYALTAAEAFGARHDYFVPGTREFVRGMIEAVSIAEQPLVLTQSILLLLLFRDGLLEGEATVVLGQGADGLFGLRMHRAVGAIERFKIAHRWIAAPLHPAAWHRLAPLLSLPPVAAAARLGFERFGIEKAVLDTLASGGIWGRGVAASDPRHVLWRLGAVGDEGWARRQFNATTRQTIGSRAVALEPFADRDVLDALSLLDFLSDVSVTQAVWSKLGESARKMVYFPFNARAVMDAAFSIPWEAKLAEPKAILRDVARTLGVPEFIVSRPKANFNIRGPGWALPDGVFEPLIPIAAKVLGERELRAMQAADSTRALTFWTMVNYAVWKRLFIDGEPLGALLEELDEATGGAARRPSVAVA